ncbi:ARM repeat-containing protein [Macrolepiota fuliginosa MF-IS2]|uniref:ARM repeat-containing protein n=1 Tax=Macrolepiota fuliginosa MF-IS2 TaxID=1400762 RepID=A0A9P5XLM3_9AGAR|nr:ARM repeat-containing protein [Macrolepiota fuliginosa MF-IS2]
MGKSQKKKKSMRRHNPMRVPDSHLPKGLASAAQSSSRNAAVLPIIQKMESADTTERKWACVAVSNLIQNDPSTRRLLQGKNVVGALITRLTDSEEEVVVEAVGALRNLCIDGGYEICAEMYNKNILTPLTTFVPKISSVLSQYLANPKAAPENAQKLVYEFADNVITVLWCLSETSNKALNAINEINLTPFLMSFLASREKLPLGPVVSAAQCLYVLTDDNPPAIAVVRTDASHLSCLLSIARPENIANVEAVKNDPRLVTLSVLAAGILRNVSPLPPPTIVSLVDLDKDVVLPLLQPTIASISISEISSVAQELITQQANEPQIEKLSLKHAPKSDHKSSVEVELEKIETRLRTVQLALEILTGACATLPDPELGPAEEEEEGDDEVLEEEDNEGDMEMEAEDVDGDQPPVPAFIPTLVNPLLALIQPSALSFPPLAAPSPHPPTTSALSAVHITALECLNNVFLSLASSRKPEVAADVTSGAKIWNDVWSALAAVGTQTGLGQERREEIWEKAVGVLWGVGNVWKGSLEPNEEQVSLLIQFCNSSSVPRVKTQCIGTLECLAQRPDSIPANRVIADYLISLLPSGATPSSIDTEPLIQVASALIDIYSDENMPYDVNFRQGQYLNRLVSSVEGVRKAVRNIDRRKEGGRELRVRGDEVRDNLVAFIKYRRGLGL